MSGQQNWDQFWYIISPKEVVSVLFTDFTLMGETLEIIDRLIER